MRRVMPLAILALSLAGCVRIEVAGGGPAGIPPSPSGSPPASAPVEVTPAAVASPSQSPSPSVSVRASTSPSASPSASPSPSPSASLSPSPSAIPRPSGPPATDLSPSPPLPAGPSAAPSGAASGEPSASPAASPPVTTGEGGFDADRVRLRLERIAEGLDQPVYVTGDGTGSGRLYIVERPGIIRILENGRVRREPLLDLSRQVATDGERGLHALAFHPRFERNGLFYVHFSDDQGRTRVVEFRARGDRQVSAGSGREIMRIGQPGSDLRGGWIGFGPDGFLYIALDDGGGDSPRDPRRTGQRKDTLLAKVLRIDVDGKGAYTIPEDNPYAKGQQGFKPETFVWGLGDPWRASFDRLTGDLWIGDVGHDQFEEVDRVPAGEGGLNFGWSDMEGDRCHLKRDCDPDDYRAPEAVYGHGPGCAVTGGYVYRGEDYPLLYGAYLFADFCSGTIWGIDADAVADGQKARVRRLLDLERDWVSFGEDDDGELYAVSLSGGIYRIQAPEAD